MKVNVNVKYRFLAPLGSHKIEPCPPDCSGCKVRRLHLCATTPSVSYIQHIFVNFQKSNFLNQWLDEGPKRQLSKLRQRS